MQTAKYIFILTILSLLVISGCTKEEPKQIYQPPVQEEELIISLEKVYEKETHKYYIYSTGRYSNNLISSGEPAEGTLVESDLNYLKSLVQGYKFNSIPAYMEGAGENCPTIILKVYFNQQQEKVLRAESCANTPEEFNKIVDEIEKLT